MYHTIQQKFLREILYYVNYTNSLQALEFIDAHLWTEGPHPLFAICIHRTLTCE